MHCVCGRYRDSTFQQLPLLLGADGSVAALTVSVIR